MIYILLISQILYNLTNAWFDGRRIKKGKRIYHGINGALYLAVIGVGVWQLWLNWTIILFVLSAFLNRQIFFDIFLNVNRGLPWDYMSKTPKSIVDKIEVRISTNGAAVNFCYIIAWAIITALFIYLNIKL